MRKTSAALAAALLVLAAAGAASAQSQPASSARSAVPTSPAAAAAELREVDGAIAWIDYLLGRVDRGDVIIELSGSGEYDRNDRFLPVNRDALIAAAQAAVAEGEMTASDAAALITAWSVQTGVKARTLRSERAELVKSRAALAVAAAAPPARPPVPPPARGRGEVDKAEVEGCQGFVGTWDTNYGPMWIGGAGNAINGSYEWNANGQRRNDTLSGSVNGNVATGSFSQPGYPDPQWASGTFTFTLSADGRSFNGTGTNAYGNVSMPWSGTCDGSVSTTTTSGGTRKF